MAKKWSEMTRDEKDAAIRQDNLGREYQDRVKEREAALDAVTAYLKESRRKRTAPTRLFQYIGYRQSVFDALTQAVQRAQEAEEAAQHAWLHSSKVVAGCTQCGQQSA